MTTTPTDQPPEFFPMEGHAMGCLVGEPGQITDVYLIEPAADQPGFYFLSHMSDMAREGGPTVDYLKLPIAARFVQAWLHTEGLEDAATAKWLSRPLAGVYKAGQSIHPFIEPFSVREAALKGAAA